MLFSEQPGQISDHTETISQAATRANELSEKLVVSNDECNGLREKLAEVKLIRDQLKEAMTKNELRAEQLHVEVEQSREELRKMKYIYELLENRYEGKFDLTLSISILMRECKSYVLNWSTQKYIVE